MPEFVLNTSPADDLPGFESLPEFLQGYIEATFFTSTGSLDDGDLAEATFADLDPEALESMRKECAEFVLQNLGDLAELFGQNWSGGGPYDAAAAGRDFWYTRNGHGVGYWDRGFTGGAAAAAERLSEAARIFGEMELYVGDDSRVYVFP